MATELEKSLREKNYWESEIVSLRRQFDDLSETNQLLPKSKGRSKEKNPKEDKKRALDDIQHLIKKCRQSG